MVLKILANLWEIEDDMNSQRFETCAIADAGQFQDLRTLDRTYPKRLSIGRK
jgi:sensor domain CHASE-containing protein